MPCAYPSIRAQSKSAVADFDPSLVAEVGQARLRCALLRYYGVVGGQGGRIGLQRLIRTSEIKMLKLDHTDAPTTDDYATVYVAFELSKAKWKLGVMVPGSAKMSRYTITGGDLVTLAARFAAARTKAARTGKPVRIVSCYEAGFDGHWLRRWLFCGESRECAAWCTYRRSKTRTANGATGSASACSRNAPPTPIASRACCTRKVSVTPCRSSRAFSTSSPACAPATGGRCRNASRRRLRASTNGCAWCKSSWPSWKPTAGPSSAPRRRARRKPRPCTSLNSRALVRSAGKGWSMKCSIAPSTIAAR